MKTAIIIGFAALAALTAPAQAKREKLSFGTGYCYTEVTFDTKKTPAAAVKDTGFLLYEDIATPVAAFPPGTAADVPANIAAFEAECTALKDKIVGLQLLPIKRYDERRAERITQIEEACRFGVARLKGPIDASAYRSFPAPACERYLGPLEGKAPIERCLRKSRRRNARRRTSLLTASRMNSARVTRQTFSRKPAIMWLIMAGTTAWLKRSP